MKNEQSHAMIFTYISSIGAPTLFHHDPPPHVKPPAPWPGPLPSGCGRPPRLERTRRRAPPPCRGGRRRQGGLRQAGEEDWRRAVRQSQRQEQGRGLARAALGVMDVWGSGSGRRRCFSRCQWSFVARKSPSRYWTHCFKIVASIQFSLLSAYKSRILHGAHKCGKWLWTKHFFSLTENWIICRCR